MRRIGVFRGRGIGEVPCRCGMPEGHRFVPGSIAELEEASGAKISDLHKRVLMRLSLNVKNAARMQSA